MKLPNEKKYPKRILINDQEYKVKFYKVLRREPNMAGECDPSDHVIRIKSGQTASDTMATFIHEVIHAFEFEYDLKIKHKLVYELERAIINFFLTNF